MSDYIFSTNAVWKEEDKFLPSNVNVFVIKFFLAIFVTSIPLIYMNIAMMFKRLRHLDYAPFNLLLLCYMPFIALPALVAAGVDLGTFGVFYLIPFFIPNILCAALILYALVAQFWLYFVCFAKSGNS